MKKSITLLLILISLSAFTQEIENFSQNKEDKVSEQIIIIEPYMKLSNGAFFMDLTLVSDNPYVDYVKGFDFEWGNRYQLKVKETIFAYPPQDVSDREFELLEVILQKPSLEKFEMILINEFYLSEPVGESISKIKTGQYSYHNKMEFKVPPKLRAEFNRKMKNKIFCKGHFVFDKQGKINLVKIE
ncbi:MAG: DUF4377 domain-containing protein [Flavobacteriales bacterium]|nr:DUF4377 domain-containing protein [Flavobacteriales bacterium]MBL6873845.1 DUF4377 domain-containing protein [Flavobacteriales bacterium]